MAETQVQLRLSFENTLRTWMGVAAAGAILVAAVLATVMINVGWGSTGLGPGVEATYTLTGIEIGPGSTAYDEFEAAGRGLILTGYIMGIIGLAFGFLAIPILLGGTLMEGNVLRAVGSGVAGISAVTLVLAVVLAPIGVSQFHADTFGAQGGALSWGAGLVLGIIATVFALGATVAALLSLRSARAEA